MKFKDFIYSIDYAFEYVKRHNHYNVHPKDDNRLIGQIWYSNTYEMWMFEAHSISIFSSENLEELSDYLVQLNHSWNEQACDKNERMK